MSRNERINRFEPIAPDGYRLLEGEEKPCAGDMIYSKVLGDEYQWTLLFDIGNEYRPDHFVAYARKKSGDEV